VLRAQARALAGLYLALERGFTGRQVQQMHMRTARASKPWPRCYSPDAVPSMTVADVLVVDEGTARDEALMEWCASVWQAWSE